MTAPSQRMAERRTVRLLAMWTASFLAIPIAGYLGTLLVGRVDNVASALVGGAVVGAMIGIAQAIASLNRLPRVRWTIATAAGMSAGVALGTFAVGYRTALGDLVVGGFIAGATIGAAQAVVLTPKLRWVWIPLTAGSWGLAWAVTTVVGVRVDEQFVVFGASGALVYTILAGVALLLALRAPST